MFSFDYIFYVCFYALPLIVGYVARLTMVAGPHAIRCSQRLMSWFHTKYIAVPPPPPPTDEERFREIANDVKVKGGCMTFGVLFLGTEKGHLEIEYVEDVGPVQYIDPNIKGDRRYDVIFVNATQKALFDAPDFPLRKRDNYFFVPFNGDVPIRPSYFRV